jgi:deubiquitinase DESI2
MSYYAGGGGGRTRMGTLVILHVYDLSPANDYLYPVGFGLHHTGVQLYDTEYSFADGAGIFNDTPKSAPNARYRESIEMGTFDGTMQDLQIILHELRDQYGFIGTKYNLLRKNCNHFANAFCWKLVSKTIPPHLNRLADFGACCSCLIPSKMLESAPVTQPTGSAGSSSSYNSGFLVNEGSRAKSLSGAPSAFSGTGNRLVAPTASSMTSRAAPADDLTDRREKARMAALSRLEQQQKQTQ